MTSAQPPDMVTTTDGTALLQRAADLAGQAVAVGAANLATQLAIAEHLATTRHEQLTACQRQLDIAQAQVASMTAELERVRAINRDLQAALTEATAGDEVVDDTTEDAPGEE